VRGALAEQLERLGSSRADVSRLFSTFNAGDETFSREARR
jgi:hypothetical protein